MWRNEKFLDVLRIFWTNFVITDTPAPSVIDFDFQWKLCAVDMPLKVNCQTMYYIINVDIIDFIFVRISFYASNLRNFSLSWFQMIRWWIVSVLYTDIRIITVVVNQIIVHGFTSVKRHSLLLISYYKLVKPDYVNELSQSSPVERSSFIYNISRICSTESKQNQIGNAVYCCCEWNKKTCIV